MKLITIISLIGITTALSYPIKSETNIEFTIALKQQNTDILREALLDISNPKSENYGKHWSIEKINKMVSPDERDTGRVLNWLSTNGIKKEEITNNGDSIICNTTLKNAEKLLKVDLIPIEIQKNIKYMSREDYKIPENLKDIVEFVEGYLDIIHIIK